MYKYICEIKASAHRFLTERVMALAIMRLNLGEWRIERTTRLNELYWHSQIDITAEVYNILMR